MDGIDLGDLIEILKKGFPIIPGVTVNQPEQAIKQFSAENIGLIKILRDPVSDWSQGDIIDKIPFFYYSEQGKLSRFSAPGMIISSTCDLDRKEKISFCPCIRMDELKQIREYQGIYKNEVFEFFFVGNTAFGDEFAVDLSHFVTLPRSHVETQLKSQEISRIHSLTLIGWYLFITKFSIQYFRPEDPSTHAER